MFNKIKRHIIVPFVFVLVFFTLSGFDNSYVPASVSKVTVEKASGKSANNKSTSSSKSKSSDKASMNVSQAQIFLFFQERHMLSSMITSLNSAIPKKAQQYLKTMAILIHSGAVQLHMPIYAKS